jgi:hypothetical protein
MKAQDLQLKGENQDATHVLQADKQATDQSIAMAKHEHERQQAEFQNSQADRSSTLSEVQAALSQKNTEESNKLALKTAKAKPLAGAAK